MSTALHRVLVVGPSWVGDMVMAQSLFIALKQDIPSCRIDVLAPLWTFSLLDRMPEVSKAIEMPLGHGQFRAADRLRLGKQLRSCRYDQTILLPNSWKSALVPFFAKITQRTGYAGEFRWGLLNDVRRLDKDRLTMTVQRFVALGKKKNLESPPECPRPKLHIKQEDQKKVRQKFSLGDIEKNVLGLCHGAEYGPAKRWPSRYFSEIARCKLEQGWDVWLFGSNKDQAIAAEVNTASGNRCRNFCGRTSLAEAVDLLSLTDVVVSNDSGLMHVASALDKKLVAIFGSSDPNFTPPLNHRARIIYLGLDCSPCFERHCRFDHYRCLGDITPDRILNEIRSL